MRNFFLLIFAVLLIAMQCHAPSALALDTDLSDPTRPSGFNAQSASSESADTKLVLTFIRLGTSPLAVINGKNVLPGTTIAGYKLVSLQITSATLVGSSGRIVLQLSPAIRKSMNYSAQNPSL